jgi:hypothetical protein
MSRIEPVQPPYQAEVGERLAAMMPPGVPPILLFRTFVRNMPMTTAMGGWGGYELSKRLSLSMRDREIIISPRSPTGPRRIPAGPRSGTCC